MEVLWVRLGSIRSIILHSGSHTTGSVETSDNKIMSNSGVIRRLTFRMEEFPLILSVLHKIVLLVMSMRCDGCNENKLPARVGNPVGGMRRDEIKVKKDFNAFINQNGIL